MRSDGAVCATKTCKTLAVRTCSLCDLALACSLQTWAIVAATPNGGALVVAAAAVGEVQRLALDKAARALRGRVTLVRWARRPAARLPTSERRAPVR